MKTLPKIIFFFLFLFFFVSVESSHHQHNEETLKKPNTPLSLEKFEKLVSSGIPVIDTRHLPENGIIKGSYWTTENGNVTKLVSFVLKPDSEYIMVSDSPKREEIIKELVEGGFKNMLGYNDFDMKQWSNDLVKAEMKKIEEMKKMEEDMMKEAFIDVRSKQELEEMGMFNNALWIPITELEERIDEVEDFMRRNLGREVVIHCRKSPRARLGASILMGKGIGPIKVLDEVLDDIRERLVPFKDESEL